MIAVAIFDFELSKDSVSQSVAWVCVVQSVTGSSPVLLTIFFLFHSIFTEQIRSLILYTSFPHISIKSGGGKNKGIKAIGLHFVGK